MPGTPTTPTTATAATTATSGATARRAPTAVGRPVVAGFGLGLAWGVAALLWTRLLASDVRPSWRTTVAVVLAAGVAGAFLGVAHAAGRRGARSSWRALALPGVALFLGPGLPFLPAFVLGGWGMSRGPFGRAVAAASVAVSPVLLVQAMGGGGAGVVVAPLDPAGLLAVAVGAGLLAVTSAWAGTAAFGPWSRPTRTATTPSAPRTPRATAPVPGAPAGHPVAV